LEVKGSLEKQIPSTKTRNANFEETSTANFIRVQFCFWPQRSVALSIQMSKSSDDSASDDFVVVLLILAGKRRLSQQNSG
jgi:hypothetical protein